MVVAMVAGYEAKRRRRLAEEDNENKKDKAEVAALEEKRDVRQSYTPEREASAVDERNGTVFANKNSTGMLLSNIRRRNLFGN